MVYDSHGNLVAIVGPRTGKVVVMYGPDGRPEYVGERGIPVHAGIGPLQAWADLYEAHHVYARQ